MKTLFLILALLPFSVLGQLVLEPKYEWLNDSSFYTAYDTLTGVSGEAVVNDSVKYIFDSKPTSLNVNRLSEYYIHVDDSTYHWYTKTVRVLVMRSRILIPAREVLVMNRKEVELTSDEIIEQALKQAKQAGLNNDQFWNYPLIDSISKNTPYLEVR